MKRLQMLRLLVLVFAASPAHAAADYDREIAPILRTYCSGCHNDKDKEAGFSVETYAALRAGGDGDGDTIAPGDPAGSVMIRRITSTQADHMPPADEPQVPAPARRLPPRTSRSCGRSSSPGCPPMRAPSP
jgi:mono/diheme cytochrome c family protein